MKIPPIKKLQKIKYLVTGMFDGAEPSEIIDSYILQRDVDYNKAILYHPAQDNTQNDSLEMCILNSQDGMEIWSSVHEDAFINL